MTSCVAFLEVIEAIFIFLFFLLLIHNVWWRFSIALAFSLACSLACSAFSWLNLNLPSS